MIAPNVRFLPFILLSILCWGLAFPFIKYSLECGLSSVTLTILRFVVVCVTFLILYMARRKMFTPLQRRDVVPIFLVGFFGVIVYHLGLNYGEQFVTAGVASLIIATIPVFTVLFALIFLKERLTVMVSAGVILSLLGVIIITLWGKTDTTLGIEYILGAAGVLLASLVGAGYTIAGKKLLERYTALSLTTYAMLLGSLGLLPFLFLDISSFINEVAHISLDVIGAIIFLGVFSTVISYTLWYTILFHTTASSLSVYVYMTPIISTIASYLLFGDMITIYFILGGALVIGGLVLVNYHQRLIRLRM